MLTHDFICLSEPYLGSSAPYSLLEIYGYNLFRADHPNDSKRGGICIKTHFLLSHKFILF